MSAPVPEGREPAILAILTTVLRADFHKPLRHFRDFSIWHFHHRSAPDIAPAELGPQVIRFRNLPDLIIKILRLKPHLIQGGEPYDFPAQLPLIVATLITSWLLRIPYYFPTFENIPPEIKFSHIRRLKINLSPCLIPFIKWLARIYSRRAALIFAVNQGAEKNMLELGVPENRISRLLYATWGVDTELFSPDEKAQPERSAQEQKAALPDMGANGILFVGRLIKEKGLLTLLDALAMVKKQVPDARLFIIGYGPLEREIHDYASRLGIADAVKFLGTIANDLLPPYFRRARVTVTPSITTRRWAEQVGMVNIQSMACGTPVISTTSGSIPEFVIDGETGILVPENDPQALAKAITRLFTDYRLWRTLSANARSYALKNYDARENIRRVEQLLKALLLKRKQHATAH